MKNDNKKGNFTAVVIVMVILGCIVMSGSVMAILGGFNPDGISFLPNIENSKSDQLVIGSDSTTSTKEEVSSKDEADSAKQEVVSEPSSTDVASSEPQPVVNTKKTVLLSDTILFSSIYTADGKMKYVSFTNLSENKKLINFKIEFFDENGKAFKSLEKSKVQMQGYEINTVEAIEGAKSINVTGKVENGNFDSSTEWINVKLDDFIINYQNLSNAKDGKLTFMVFNTTETEKGCKPKFNFTLEDGKEKAVIKEIQKINSKSVLQFTVDIPETAKSVTLSK